MRHVPRRVHLLVVDLVEAGRRLEPGAADRDAVRLHELQPLEESQRERLAADEDHRAVAPLERRRPPARQDGAGRDGRRVRESVGAQQRGGERALELRLLDGEARLATGRCAARSRAASARRARCAPAGRARARRGRRASRPASATRRLRAARTRCSRSPRTSRRRRCARPPLRLRRTALSTMRGMSDLDAGVRGVDGERVRRRRRAAPAARAARAAPPGAAPRPPARRGRRCRCRRRRLPSRSGRRARGPTGTRTRRPPRRRAHPR